MLPIIIVSWKMTDFATFIVSYQLCFEMKAHTTDDLCSVADRSVWVGQAMSGCQDWSGYRFVQAVEWSGIVITKAHGFQILKLILTNTLLKLSLSKKWNTFETFASSLINSYNNIKLRLNIICSNWTKYILTCFIKPSFLRIVCKIKYVCKVKQLSAQMNE